MSKRSLLISYKLILAILGLTAIATEIITLVDRGVFKPANFFSFFTIESNVFIAIMLLWGSIALWRGQMVSALWRGAATLYIATTGIIFSLLLSHLPANVLTAVPWDNMVLHYIMPIAALLDWIIDPPGVKISFKQTAVWLIYPIAYLIYSLIRGLVIDWYPYPFLDPATSGYAGIAIVAVGIALVELAIGWLLIWRLKRS